MTRQSTGLDYSSNARPHNARHAAATLLLESGGDVRVVQVILKRSSLAVTKRDAPSEKADS
ncbi:tyrosine-type recombinase/integrase [Kribbella sp. NPDC050124]|uniref:tyrosine-type recombinase/integrase n=1 Tax=Kribbella sp. NPDC050124 TaxID=3364114 RepID=UPI0037A05EBC